MCLSWQFVHDFFILKIVALMTQLTLLLLAQLFNDLIHVQEVIPFCALTAKWDAAFC